MLEKTDPQENFFDSLENTTDPTGKRLTGTG